MKRDELEDTLFRVMAERDHLKNTLGMLATFIPDMVWVKDINGKYLYANQQLINGLLFTGTMENTVGRCDTAIAADAKKKFGDENHTFGQVCGNSDVVVLQHQKPMYFVEHGIVNGKKLVLEVHKNIVRDAEGNTIGTCGTARDITWQSARVTDIIGECPDSATKRELTWLLEKNKYE